MMAENFPTDNQAEHHDYQDALLKRSERLKEDIHHLRINASDALHEVGEDARAVTGMASMVFGMPTLNPIVASDDDDEDSADQTQVA